MSSSPRYRILYFSDCYMFGGSEKIIINLFHSDKIKENYDLFFIYRKNKQYSEGVHKNFQLNKNISQLVLLSFDNIYYKIDHVISIKIVQKIIKFPFWLLQSIGILSIINLFILAYKFILIKPDILHINNGGYPGAFNCRIAVFSAYMAGIKKIVFQVNNIAKSQKTIVDKIIDRFINKQVTYFITASRLAKIKLAENRLFDPQKIIQIYNTITPNKIQWGKEELLLEYKLPFNSFILVEVALLTDRKGQMHLLAALNNLRKSNPELFDITYLFLVGDGENRTKILDYINRNDLIKHVTLTGHRYDYYNFINAADIFILPSISNEDMPLVILEAMFLKKSIIATDVAGIPEQIRNNIDGILIDPQKMDEFSLVIRKLLEHKQLREKLSENAYQHFIKSFSYETTMTRYLDIYNSLNTNLT